MLITFLLCAAGAIHEPILNLSLYLKMNRLRYYELLDRVRTYGDWETWLEFFLTGSEGSGISPRLLPLRLCHWMAQGLD